MEYEASNDERRKNSSIHATYQDGLKALYTKILQFQATCICYPSKPSASRILHDIIAWDDWDGLLKQVDDQINHMASLEIQWQGFKLQERWHIESEQHEARLEALHCYAKETSHLRALIEAVQSNQARQQLLGWLSSPVVSTRYNHIREQHEFLTGNWLLEAHIYDSWKNTLSSFLWLYGKGKCRTVSRIQLRRIKHVELMLAGV